MKKSIVSSQLILISVILQGGKYSLSETFKLRHGIHVFVSQLQQANFYHCLLILHCILLYPNYPKVDISSQIIKILTKTLSNIASEKIS